MLPLGKCYTYANWKDAGGITVIVSRIHPKGTVTCADFCIDKLCRGVRGTRYFFNISPENLEEIVEYYSDAENDRMVEIPYEVAHNLIYGSIELAGKPALSLLMNGALPNISWKKMMTTFLSLNINGA